MAHVELVNGHLKLDGRELVPDSRVLLCYGEQRVRVGIDYDPPGDVFVGTDWGWFAWWPVSRLGGDPCGVAAAAAGEDPAGRSAVLGVNATAQDFAVCYGQGASYGRK